MKRIALALIVVTLLTSVTVSAYYVSVNNSHQGENSLPTASPVPASTPTPTPTPTPTSSPTSTPKPTQSPTPTPTPTPFPDSSYTEGGDWLPLGLFGVTSPTNQTYNTNSLLLNVSGVTVAGTPSLAYSLDGGQRVPIPLEFKQVTMMQVSFSGSVALPPLANGSHVIVVYGDLTADARRSKVTVYFEIEKT